MGLKGMPLQQLRYGVIRCEARLSGVLPIGLMRTETRVKEALKEYKQELIARGQNEFDFK